MTKYEWDNTTLKNKKVQHWILLVWKMLTKENLQIAYNFWALEVIKLSEQVFVRTTAIDVFKRLT